MKTLEDILNKRSKIDTQHWNEIHTFLNEEGISDNNMQLSLLLHKVILCAELHENDRQYEASKTRRGLIEALKLEIIKCDLIINDPFFNAVFECDVEKAKQFKKDFTYLLQKIKKTRSSPTKTLIETLTPVMIKFRMDGKKPEERIDIIYNLFVKFGILDKPYTAGDQDEFNARDRIRKWDSKIMEEPNKLIRKYTNVKPSGR